MHSYNVFQRTFPGISARPGNQRRIALPQWARRLLLLAGLLLLPLAGLQAQELPDSVRIACPNDAAPFSFVDADNRLRGMTIDLWRRWADHTGIAVRFIPAPWEQTLTMLRDGEADIHSGLTINDERETWLEFVAPVAFTDVNFFFHKTLFGLERLDDLRAFKIGVIKGSYLEAYLTEQLPGAALERYATFDELFAAARAGDIRVFLRSVENTLWELKQRGASQDFRYHPERPLHRSPFWAAISKGQPELAAVIRQGMATITPDERAEIERRWLGNASVKTKDTVIIGMSRTFPPISYLNEQGEPAGFFVDIWRLWAEKTGTQIELYAGEWPELFDRLKRGDVDIHAGLFTSEERDQWLSYSQPFYRSSAALVYPANQDGLASLDDLAGERLGVVAQSYQESYVRTYYPAITVVPFDTTRAMIAAARQGRIRAFLAETLSIAQILDDVGATGLFESAASRLFTRSIHAGVLKENTDLLARVDAGFDAISHQELAELEARWIADPDKRYYHAADPKIRLTTAESAWLKANPTIRVGLSPGFPPLMFHEHGKLTGMFADYLQALSEITGIRFEPVSTPVSQLDTALQQGHIDIFLALDIPGRPTDIRLTRPFLDFQLVIVARNNVSFVSDLSKLRGKTLAVIRGAAIHAQIVNNHPGIVPYEVDTLHEALKAVSTARADALVMGMMMTSHLARDYPNLRIVGLADLPPLPYGYAVRRDRPELLGILNKAIAAIPQARHEAIRQAWFPVQVEYRANWSEIIWWLVGIGSAAALVIGLTLYWNRRLAREVLERKQAVEALRESERTFRTIVNVLPQFLAYVDSDLRYRFVNTTYERIFGLAPEAVLGKRLPDIIGAEAFEKARPHVEKALRGERVRYHEQYEYATVGFRDIDGVLIPDCDGERVKGYYAVLTDITPYIAMQDALKEREENFKALFTASPDAILLADAETGLIVNANEAAARLFEKPLDAIIGTHQTRLHPADESERAERAFRYRPTGKDDQAPPVEMMILTGQNTTGKMVEIRGKEVRMRGKAYIIGNFRDITARKQAEHALKESLIDLKLAQHLASIGNWQFDPDLGVPVWSEQVYTIYERDPALGPPHVDEYARIYDEEQYAIFSAAFHKAANDGTPYDIVLKLKLPHGKVKWVHAICQPEYRKSEAGYFLRGTIQDITARVEAEQALQTSEAHLKAALEEKDVLLQEVYHRVKNNLMVVQALIEMQADETTNPEALDLFRDLRNRVMSMSMVHEDLYQSDNLSQIEFGPYLERLVNNIRAGFAQNRAILTVSARNVFLNVRRAIPCGLIVAELVTNAFKYAFPPASAGHAHPEAKERPEICVEMRYEPPVYTLRVSDNGVGLPPELDLQKPKTLGLTLVRSWAEHQLRGQIQIDTRHGTRFTMTFTDTESRPPERDMHHGNGRSPA